jgi:hypothetical protein
MNKTSTEKFASSKGRTMTEEMSPDVIQKKIEKYRKMLTGLDDVTARRVKSLIKDFEQILGQLRERK